MSEKDAENPNDLLLKQHFQSVGEDMEELLKRAAEDARLTDDEAQAAVEAFPVGTVIEKEGPGRWRVHVRGQNRYGHGATFREASEAFILGNPGERDRGCGAQVRPHELPPAEGNPGP